MEYFLCRAMEIARLTPEQRDRLQKFESTERQFMDFDIRTGTYRHMRPKERLALMPFEIQDCFQLCSLKEHYAIPEIDAAQSVHNQRLRALFRALGIYPDRGDISSLKVDEVHAFDEKVVKAIESGKLQLHYEMAPRGKRMKDQFKGEGENE